MILKEFGGLLLKISIKVILLAVALMEVNKFNGKESNLSQIKPTVLYFFLYLDKCHLSEAQKWKVL